MRYSLIVPQTGGTIEADDPEHIVRAFSLARVLGLGTPPQVVVSWFNRQCSAYDGQPGYWSPYGFVGPVREGASIYIEPWARAGAGMMGKHPVWHTLDPSLWYQGLAQHVIETYEPEGRLRGAFEVADEQTDPNGPNGVMVNEMWAYIRQAINNRVLVTDRLTLNRRREALRRRGFDI